jgi:hypothetical protein
LVVFDEPGQQDISDDSLRALFARLGTTGDHDQQAIIATSKPHAQLTQLLTSSPAHRNDFTGYVLHAEP